MKHTYTKRNKMKHKDTNSERNKKKHTDTNSERNKMKHTDTNSERNKMKHTDIHSSIAYLITRQKLKVILFTIRKGTCANQAGKKLS